MGEVSRQSLCAYLDSMTVSRITRGRVANTHFAATLGINAGGAHGEQRQYSAARKLGDSIHFEYLIYDIAAATPCSYWKRAEIAMSVPLTGIEPARKNIHAAHKDTQVLHHYQ